MRMTTEEKRARAKLVSGMFQTLNVKQTDEGLRGWLNATALIPFKLFAAGIAKVIREKDDGYQTAPQPGVLWKACRALIPRSQWEYTPTTGTLPPKWFRSLERENAQKMLAWSGAPAKHRLPVATGIPQRAVDVLEDVFPGSEVISHRDLT